MPSETLSATAMTALDKMIAGFDGDPADSDYQRGFLAALEAVRAEAGYPELYDALAELRRMCSDIVAVSRNDRFQLVNQRALQALAKAGA